MKTQITGRCFKFILLNFILIFIFSNNSIASEFDPCTDIVIDQSTRIAYGAHGAPFDGEFICYRDAKKTKPTIKRKFNNGIAIGQHFCFDDKGIPEWVIVYLNGKRWKMDVFKNRFKKVKDINLPQNYYFTACDASGWTRDWCEKANFKDCLPE